MSGKVTQFMKTQKYRFDFGADGKLYITIFHGKIPQPELKGMVSSLQTACMEKPQHNAIAQTYLYHRETCEECGYFAIRKAIGNVLYTIDSSEGKPVLPTFGCVDMAALLAEIETINSKEDAIKTAIK